MQKNNCLFIIDLMAKLQAALIIMQFLARMDVISSLINISFLVGVLTPVFTFYYLKSESFRIVLIVMNFFLAAMFSYLLFEVLYFIMGDEVSLNVLTASLVRISKDAPIYGILLPSSINFVLLIKLHFSEKSGQYKTENGCVANFQEQK